MSEATVCVLVGGDEAYARVAWQSVLSVVEHTPFDVRVGHTFDLDWRVPAAAPVELVPLAAPTHTHRAYRFLQKFELLERVLERSDSEFIIMLDADAVLARRLTAADLEEALGGHGLGMTEQTGIVRSTMSRPDFLQHYRDHSLAFIEPGAAPPSLGDFRFFNSGVVIARRMEMAALVEWAQTHIAASDRDHQVGEHMIADQDYFQVWANNRHAGSCAQLSWDWNHCELWDDGFPRNGLRIAHFSNFCRGPEEDTAERMEKLRLRAQLAVPGASLASTQPDPLPELDIVIVTHQSAEVIDTCLDAVAVLPGSHEVTVVDNHSTDDTRELVRRHGHEVVETGANLGYAAAANIGARRGRAPLLCFLNPDCVITPGVVEQAQAALAEDQRACAVPAFRHADGSIVPGRQPGYSRRKLLADIVENAGDAGWTAYLKRDDAHHDTRWHWPLGACLFVPRSLFEELGGFDERYFVYMEDVRFGRTLHHAGGRVVGLDSTLEHLGGMGSAVSNAQRIRLLDEARLRYATDRYGHLLALTLRGARAAARLRRRVSNTRPGR